jgi:probable rRNA maturation factor
LSIKFFYDKIKFRVKGSREIRKFLGKVISGENKTPGDLNFIFTTDEVLLGINKEFLKHNYLTDVITFDYSKKEWLNGEVYISIDALRRNARLFNVRLNDELVRVMIHGTLHLCGYLDDSEEHRDKMFRRQEQLTEMFRKKKGNGF